MRRSSIFALFTLAFAIASCALGARSLAVSAAPKTSLLPDVTWTDLRDKAIALSKRSSSFVQAGDASMLATPQMRGEGGASAFFVRLPGGADTLTDLLGERDYYFKWRYEHGYFDAAAKQGLSTYYGLLTKGEGRLRQLGLPVDSVGSSLAYALVTYYDLVDGPQNPNALDQRELRGYVVLLMALFAQNGAIESSDQREALYQKILVDAEQLREAAAADPTHADAYRDSAAAQLRLVGIDAKAIPLDRVICSLAGPAPCAKVYSDASPILARLADAFPF